MTAKNEVATAGVKDLVRPTSAPPLEIDAEDVALPRLYIGQYMSDAVKDQLVSPGAIYVGAGADDPDPNVLWSPDQDKDKGPVFHVLSLFKGKSVTTGGELVLFQFNDPEAPADAWTTYNYTIAIPEADNQVPFKWLLTRTGTPAAKQINTALVKAAGTPPWEIAFRVHSDKRENAKGEYFVPRITTVEATSESVAVSAELAQMISGRSSDFTATGEAPAI